MRWIDIIISLNNIIVNLIIYVNKIDLVVM